MSSCFLGQYWTHFQDSTHTSCWFLARWYLPYLSQTLSQIVLKDSETMIRENASQPLAPPKKDAQKLWSSWWHSSVSRSNTPTCCISSVITYIYAHGWTNQTLSKPSTRTCRGFIPSSFLFFYDICDRFIECLQVQIPIPQFSCHQNSWSRYAHSTCAFRSKKHGQLILLNIEDGPHI